MVCGCGMSLAMESIPEIPSSRLHHLQNPSCTSATLLDAAVCRFSHNLPFCMCFPHGDCRSCDWKRKKIREQNSTSTLQKKENRSPIFFTFLSLFSFAGAFLHDSLLLSFSSTVRIEYRDFLLCYSCSAMSQILLTPGLSFPSQELFQWWRES